MHSIVHVYRIFIGKIQRNGTQKTDKENTAPKRVWLITIWRHCNTFKISNNHKAIDIQRYIIYPIQRIDKEEEITYDVNSIEENRTEIINERTDNTIAGYFFFSLSCSQSKWNISWSLFISYIYFIIYCAPFSLDLFVLFVSVSHTL